MDAVVTASGLRTPAIRIVREGRILPASSFTRAASIAGQALTGLVDARRVLDEVRGGATVVLQGLHRYWPPLTDLITALERELGHPCQANAYLTPAGSQGFAPHRDTHDVFVVQSEGAKTWRLGEEGEEEEVELHPGRVLYLPTGTRHSARAQDDLSLHVTIGINQFTWRGLVRRALLASLDEIEDGHLPAGWLDDPTEVLEGLRQRLAAVAEQLATSDPTTVVVAHEQDFLTSRPPRLAGGLVDALRGDDVDDDTPCGAAPRAPRCCVAARTMDCASCSEIARWTCPRGCDPRWSRSSRGSSSDRQIWPRPSIHRAESSCVAGSSVRACSLRSDDSLLRCRPRAR